MSNREIMDMTGLAIDWKTAAGKENIADGTGYTIVTDITDMIGLTGIIMITMQMTVGELL
jgi:hypothetical protein